MHKVGAIPCGIYSTITGTLPAVAGSITEIVPRLLTRFSSKEGYKLFGDAIPVRQCPSLLHCVYTANTDANLSRI
jgi:hypothetical protein